MIQMKKKKSKLEEEFLEDLSEEELLEDLSEEEPLKDLTEIDAMTRLEEELSEDFLNYIEFRKNDSIISIRDNRNKYISFIGAGRFSSEVKINPEKIDILWEKKAFEKLLCFQKISKNDNLIVVRHIVLSYGYIIIFYKIAKK
jgi:hypothetical protein